MPRLNGATSTHQFGGVRGRSTTGAIMAMKEVVQNSTNKFVMGVFLGIGGAFDNLWWPSILKALKRVNCPCNVYRLICSYLSDREAMVPLPNKKVRHRITKGCPQGSILGPYMWNLVFKEALDMLQKQRCTPFAFVDDLVVVVEAETIAALKRSAHEALQALSSWCKVNKLALNPGKTKLLLLKGAVKRRDAVRINVGEVVVTLSDNVKYLGVTLGERLLVSPHIADLKNKVTQRYGSLVGIARNTWGLNTWNRLILYKALYLPIVSYAAPAWFANPTKTHVRMLTQSQRKALLVITRAYKTVSTDALQVLAGQLPVDLEVQLRLAKYCLIRGFPTRIGDAVFTLGQASYEDVQERMRNKTIELWQARWDSSTKGRITHEFLPKVRDRLSMEWFDVDFYTTQLLTGHGDINYKLHYFSIKDSPRCKCGEEETVRHIIFDCPNYSRARLQLAGEYSLLEWPPAALSELTKDEQIFSAFRKYANAVFAGK